MLVKNLTRFPFATVVTSRRPPQVEMAVVVRGRFDPTPGGPMRAREGLAGVPFDPMAQGVLSGDTYAESDDEALGAVVHPSDLAPYKLNAEVLVVGPCHAPRGGEVAECTVGVKLGEWSKGLRVVGRRTSASKPVPFSTMPLDWTNAFGGPGDPDNPVGKGRVGAELPNVLSANGDARSAAGMGPINARWAHRWAKVGKNYGPEWKKTRSPWPSDDFDWSHHHSALPDQQLRGYLKGDERLVLSNLHPGHALIETQLPGARVRAFVRRASREIVEVPLSIDTLVVRSDLGAVDLAWRGLVEVAEDDLADVLTMLLIRDDAGVVTPRSDVIALMEKLEADPTGAIEATPPDLLEKRDQAMATLEQMRIAQDDMRSGRKSPEEAIPVIFASALPPGDPRAEQVQVAAKRAVADVTASAPPGKRPFDALVAQMPPSKAASPVPLRIPDASAPPKLPPKKDLGASIDAAIAEAKKARVELERDPKGEGAAKGDELVARLEALKADPRFELVFKPRVEPGPDRDLSDQDLEGEDLRGVDLRGANLEGAILTRADLRGANLTGAKLSHAVLFQARLDDADLSSCTMLLTNLTEASGEGLKLRHATCDKTFFDRASLPRLDATAMKAIDTLFIEAQLPGASFERSKLTRAFFDRAALEGASFVDAELVSCLLLSCALRRARFERAGIGGTSFLRSDASGASFDRAHGASAVFLEATLDDATFVLARLPSIFTNTASLKRARFYGADLQGGRFTRANVERATFERANLKDADLRKVVAGGTSFRGASLFGANLLGAAGRDADFGGANLKRAQIEGVSG